MQIIGSQSRVRGYASVLAMMFLVLFSTLALAFYTMSSTAIESSNNDQQINRALLAADSGMDFIRYQLQNVTIPPSTPAGNVVNALYEDLVNQMEETGNLGGNAVELSGNIIYVPQDGSISLASNQNAIFRATITDWAGEIVVKIDGTSLPSGLTRSITMDFTRRQRTSTIYNYAVASKGIVRMRKGTVTAVAGVDPSIATMMSAKEAEPSIIVSGGVIGGDLSIVEGATASVTGGTVGGSSIPGVILADHVHEVEPPEFPTVDTSVYRSYATNTFVDGARTQQNIRIPAGTNPRFNGGDSVQGIMYIESPNTVTFRGNFNLQGFIVFENTADETANVLDFRGNVSQNPLPSGAAFDSLRATTGVSILAPTTKVFMSGSTDSLLRGNVIIGKLDYNGSADVQIDRGTIMTYNEGSDSAGFNGKTVKFTATGSNNQPTSGISFSSNFRPDPTSYQEISP